MKTGRLLAGLIALGLLGAAGYGVYRAGLSRGMEMAASPATPPAPGNGSVPAATHIDPATGRKVLYWHDPMVPGQKFDKPGKSPFMDMQLVPVYADEGGDNASVSISPRMQQSLGIRTTEAAAGTLPIRIEAVGSVAYDERDVAVVQARSSGFVEKLYVRAPLNPVRKGQPLADLYVPDWVAAQEEFLSTRWMEGTRLEALIDGARQRMRLAGMTERQIRLVESSGEVHARLTIDAPIDGVVSELVAREGMTVAAGATLFRISGLSRVWVNADVPENLASRIRPGDAVQARTPSLPDAVFKGRVSAILPEVDVATRTVKARIELANPGRRLIPGMFATVNLASSAIKEAVLVPTEAIIRTGSRNVVIVVQDDGRFAPIDVETGLEGDGRTEIRAGLNAGQKVVVSGQFLIDSEASLRGTALRMNEAPAPDGDTGEIPTHRGEGKVERKASAPPGPGGHEHSEGSRK
jgi:Cu(I)/Ag(I) efflux system membrane fusion protein